MRIFIETISIISMAFLALSTFAKKKKDMIKVQIISIFFNAVANFLIGGFAAFVVNLSSILRDILVYKKKMNTEIIFLICVVVILLGVAVNKIGSIGLLPVFASAIYTLGVFYSKNAQSLRYLLLLNNILWLIHDFSIGLISMAIIEGIVIIITSWNIYRYAKISYKKTLKKQKYNYRLFYKRAYCRTKARIGAK